MTHIMYRLKEMIKMEVSIYLELLCLKNILWHSSCKNLMQIIKIQKDSINLNFLMEFKRKEYFKVDGSIVISLK